MEIREASPSSKRTHRSENPLGSSLPPYASSDVETNHNTLATTSVPPVHPIASPIELEELDLWTTQAASHQLPKLFSTGALVRLADRYVPLL